MLNKIFSKDSTDSLDFQDLHSALLEASDAIKVHIRHFDIVSFLLLLASGNSISDQDLPYFKDLASEFNFYQALRRMRGDPDKPCAGEMILDKIFKYN